MAVGGGALVVLVVEAVIVMGIGVGVRGTGSVGDTVGVEDRAWLGEAVINGSTVGVSVMEEGVGRLVGEEVGPGDRVDELWGYVGVATIPSGSRDIVEVQPSRVAFPPETVRHF